MKVDRESNLEPTTSRTSITEVIKTKMKKKTCNNQIQLMFALQSSHNGNTDFVTVARDFALT